MECTSGGKSEAQDQFPAGMRVLVVDNDVVCLSVLEEMLRSCMYNVTCCSKGKVALRLLRKNRGCFDLVLSEVHMPDMDDFKILEVGLETDLPVILMSRHERPDLVMRATLNGACDYLIKPMRNEELKVIWQHVVRKRWNEIKERQKWANGDANHTSRASKGALEAHKKRRDSKYDDDDKASKKPHIIWSDKLHQHFVNVVNQLGIDKAVPKTILELMNVPGLTRENVASHLQKYRFYLKRLYGVAHLRENLNQLSSLGLTALETEFLAGNFTFPTMDQRTLSLLADQNVSYSGDMLETESGHRVHKHLPSKGLMST